MFTSRPATLLRSLTVASLLCATIALPGAQAASASGKLDVEAPITIIGATSLSSTSGLLVLQHLTTLGSLRIDAASASVAMHEITYLQTAPLLIVPDTNIETDRSDSTESFDAVTVTFEPHEKAYIAAYPLQDQAAYSVDLDANQIVVQTRGAERVTSEEGVGTDAPGFVYQHDYDSDHFLLEPSEGTLTLTGDIGVFVYNALIRVADAQGAQASFETGRHKTQENGVTSEHKESWLYLTLHDAVLTFTISEPGVAIRSEEITGTTTGLARFESATGRLSDGTYEYNADDQPVSVRGRLEFTLEPAGEDNAFASMASGAEPRAIVSFAGAIDSVNVPRGRAVGGVPAFVESPVGKASILGSLSAAFLVMGYVTVKQRRSETRAPFLARWRGSRTVTRSPPRKVLMASVFESPRDALLALQSGALLASPDVTQLLLMGAKAGADHGNWLEALEFMRAVRGVEPTLAEYASAEAFYQRKLGRHEEALSAYAKAADLGDATARVDAAVCAASMGDAASALSFVQEALETEPCALAEILNAPGLEAVRSDPAFARLVNEARARAK